MRSADPFGPLTIEKVLAASRRLRSEFDPPLIRTPFRPLATPEQDGFGLAHPFGALPIQIDAKVPRFAMERRQVRFPRSKRGRIRRKWARRPSNWQLLPKRPLEPLILRIAGELWMHPETWADACRALGVRGGLELQRSNSGGHAVP